jgi:hypothetical protein
MAVTKDQKTIRYGTQDGHQPTYQPMKANEAIYAGTIAVTKAGYAISAKTGLATTDICWGLYNGLINGSPAVSTPITAGTTNGDTLIGIDTGTFYLQNGTNSDAFTQADVGATAYVVDEVTVGKTDGSAARPVAGKVANIGSGQYAGLIAVTLGNNTSTGSP